jgi:hypothetical protein
MRVNELSARGVQGKGDESIRLVSSTVLTVQSVNRSGLARTVERLFVSFTAVTGGAAGGGTVVKGQYKEIGTLFPNLSVDHTNRCPLGSFQRLSRLENGPQVPRNNDTTRGKTAD